MISSQGNKSGDLGKLGRLASQMLLPSKNGFYFVTML